MLHALLVSLALLAPQSEPARKLTLDDVFTLTGRIMAPITSQAPQGWIDESRYLASKDGVLVAVDAATGDRKPLFDPAEMQAALGKLPGITEAQARAWSQQGHYTFAKGHGVLLIQDLGDLFAYDLRSKQAARLTHDPAEEVGATLSPDGALCAYIHEGNLHVVPTAGGTPRALTSGGSAEVLFGRLDWVYQEELYGRGNFGAFWWSPDSSRIAFLKLDETQVGRFQVVDHTPLMQDVETWRYPKAGQPNPKAELGVVQAAGDPVVWMDLTPYRGAEFLIVRVGWTPDGKEVAFQITDRTQTWLDLCLGDPATGKVTRLFRETTPAWIEADADHLFWRKSGREFVWLSERDGYRHLYLYGRDGKLIRRLTEGSFEVEQVHGIDDDKRVVWFSTDKDDTKGSQLYRVGLDGQGLERATREPGTHTIFMAPGCGWFADAFSSAKLQGRMDLCRGDGTFVRSLGTADLEPLKPFALTPPEFIKVKARDGFELEALLIKPANFDSAKKYPVLCHTYSGPHTPQVRDRFGGRNYLWHQMLAQEGYVIWICDNRSASGKGLAAHKACYRNFGQTELADLEDGLDWLVAQGFVDPARIGMWGWSFGGYMTAFALTHSTRFKMGIAGAPVTDWALYDSIYTERYMDLPQNNPEGYRRASVLEAAANLSGKLLLIHGVIDENVHLQNSLKFADALQQAGKQFQFMVYPRNRHGITQPSQARHLQQLMTDFVRNHL